MEVTRGSACEPGMHACTHDVDVTQVSSPSCEAFAGLLEAAARREAQDRGRMKGGAAG